jgi:predicted metal-binding membrane protein
MPGLRDTARRGNGLEPPKTMTEAADRDLNHLPPAESRLGALFARPKAVAVVCVVALAALGWSYLALLAAADANGLIDALCRAMVVEVSLGGTALVALMWAAMILAMMLPSAAPMIYTYAEIADTAAKKGERIVSPFVLAAGYTAVWLGFAALATAAQLAFTRLAFLDEGMASASGLFSGAIFIAAGLYQFSALKHACLTQCRNPFPFFFTNWATTPRGVFRLGIKQGLFCLGCCWAMMAVMFAVGVMNVVWMAALGIVMTAEKFVTGRRFTQVVGVALLAAGAAFVFFAFAAHWPGRAI